MRHTPTTGNNQTLDQAVGCMRLLGGETDDACYALLAGEIPS
jgi:hypothetical protein